jgi:hypothetical protein
MDLARARGYIVAMDSGPTPSAKNVRLVPIGASAKMERKGLTGLRFGGRLLGDVQYRAQAFRVDVTTASP